jgi:hypothetical protein
MAITALMLKRLERRLIRLFVSGLGPLIMKSLFLVMKYGGSKA